MYLWRSPSLRWLSVASIGLSVVLSLILAMAFIVIPPIAFRREPKFRDEYLLTFSHESVHFKTANIDSVIQWGMYSRALIDSHSYLLYYGTGSFSLIPKRAFQGTDQQKAFEVLLTESVPRIISK
jgi:hypothetical protein